MFIFFMTYIKSRRNKKKNTNNCVDIFKDVCNDPGHQQYLVVDLDHSISGGRGHDCKVVRFTTTYAISV